MTLPTPSTTAATALAPLTKETLAAFQQLNQALSTATSVLLTVHINPDGDALGSLLACQRIIQTAFPNITTCHGAIDGSAASYLDILPGFDGVLDGNVASNLLNTPYDVAIACDSGSIDRLGVCGTAFQQAKLSVNLDHHVSNTQFADLNIVLTDAAASGEVVALWASTLDSVNLVNDLGLATALYTTIVTDTGGFRFNNTRPYTHYLASQCLQAGVDHTQIYKRIYENRPKAQNLLIHNAVSRAHFDLDDRLCWVVVSQADQSALNATDEHTEGIVDALRQIREVKVAALIKGCDDGTIKFSLRSDDSQYDVGSIATELGGGGHIMAAGCSLSNTTLEDAEALLLKKLKALF